MEGMIFNIGNLSNCMLSFQNEDDFYCLTLNTENGEEMGFVSFSLDEQEGHVWLKGIGTNDKFQHNGVATMLVCMLEKIAVENGYYTVKGIYHPLNEFAEKFYIKNGYSLPTSSNKSELFDDSWCFTKTLDAFSVTQRYNWFVESKIASKKENAM